MRPIKNIRIFEDKHTDLRGHTYECFSTADISLFPQVYNIIKVNTRAHA